MNPLSDDSTRRDAAWSSRALAALARLPMPVLHVLARLLALLAMYVIRYRRQVVRDNLSRAFPALSESARHDLMKAFYRNVADVALETLKAGAISQKELNARVRITNLEMLDRFADAGQSIVLLGAHEANWEWVFLACSGRLPFAVDVIYKPLHNAVFDAFVARTRSRFGAHLIVPNDALKELVKGRDRLRAIALLVDQRPAAGNESHRVSFLDQDTPFLVGFEKLARLWKYPVVFAARHRTRRGHYEVTFEILGEPPYDSTRFEIVQRYASALERSIRKHPADWLWSHRRWLAAKPL
jgi:KDO2-lipid IV(A) lauroyltransferase